MNPNTGRKKWLIAIVIAAVLIAAAVAVAILAGPGPDDPVIDVPKESPLGVYYYDTAEGEYLLTLSQGNVFMISGPSLNKSGKCVVTDDGIELNFVKDEDGTGSLKEENGVMVLQYKDKTMRFLKKVTYAVTFNANGGSEVASIHVVNGKTVSKPTDPSKEGNVFIGWYADEACTKLYPFGTEAVTANTTVYAKWAETVVGQNEYTVDFDLGYDAEGYAAMATIGGKLYNVPSPERDGYTFGGWWVSMTQKADALTIPYTEEMVFQANTTLFALWQTAPEGGKLEAPLVEVYADSIKWNTVKGASSYELKILNAKGEEVFTEQLGTTTKNYNFSELTAGEYTVQVTALSTVEENNSDVTTRTFVNKALDRVSLFTVVDGGILLWNGVEGAEKYLITIDCGNDAHKHTAFDNGDSTTFMFANCDMREGGIKFTVTAVAEGKASSVSDTFVYDRKLDAVGEILYNEETQSFYWDAVANAAKYSITVKVGNKTFTIDNGSATTFSAKYLSGDITLEIIPMTQGYNSPEATTTTYKKTSLATPESLTVSGNVLSWNAVDGATGYMVKINNQSFQAAENSLDLTTTTLTFDSSTTYDICVMAVGAESSLYSDVVTMKYLAPIESVTYKNNTVTWTPVMGVENYEVRVNGGEPITVSGTNSAKVVLTKAGVNLIEVRYTDLGGSKWASTEVFAYAVTYDSRSLNGTVTEFLAMGDTMMLPGEFTQDGYDFTGWYNSPDAANGNGAVYSETVFNGTGTMVLYGNWTPRTYYVEFVGMSGVTNITEGEKQAVIYKDGFQLPIPEASDEMGEFMGWYTGPGGSGVVLTDAKGNSLTDYAYTRDAVAYPVFNNGVLTYILQEDGTYAVTAGPNIEGTAVVTIPEYYKSIPVTTILENAFYGVSNIEKIVIPATIRSIGVGAIENHEALKEINVYTDTIQQNYEVFYSSYDGALLKHDMGTINLEVFPRGKTGEYTIPDHVNVIRDNVFRYSQINRLTVGNGVTLISRRAFYRCEALNILEFKDGGNGTLTIDDEAFFNTSNLTVIRFPARLAEIDLQVLNTFTKLTILEVEDGGTTYSSRDNGIYNAIGDTILFAPMAISGEYEIPVGIREIGPMAFAYRTGVTKISVPAYVNKISENAFFDCSGITEVIIEGNRGRDLLIDKQAFAGCDRIGTIMFCGNGTKAVDSGVVTIGASAFEGLNQLRRVVFEAGIHVVIGQRAFAANENINAVDYADGAVIQSIGNEAYAGCSQLPEAIIPATTSFVGDGAFSGCENIRNVVFRSRELEITFGTNVFEGCKRLTTVNLPAMLNYFDGTVFAGCDSIVEILVDEANQNFITYNGALYTKDYSEILFYPRALDGDLTKLHPELKKIGAKVFQGNAKITKAVIGGNVIAIGDYAFENCAQLTEVIFSNTDSAMTVGMNAFAKCTALTGINLPAGTTVIGDGAFENSALSAVAIPEATVSIGKNAFKATKITKVEIPANVESIGDGAFANCTSLVTVTFAEGSKPLTLGTLANTNTSNGVFYNTKIVELTLGDRVTMIGAYAFYNQTNLTTVTMSSNSQVTDIGKYAFGGSSTTKLANLTLGPNLETIHPYALARIAATTINIPKSVEMVDEYAFQYATAKEVIFEGGGTAALTIKRYAFANMSKLETVTLPARLETLYETATLSFCDGTFKNLNGRFNNDKLLKDINVEPGGQNFCSFDGVLYEMDKEGNPTILLFCPLGKTGEFVIPKEVRLVENGAFVNSQLTKISFEEYDKADPNYGQPLLGVGVGFAKTVSGNNNYAVFSGNIQKINFPSHLKRLGIQTCRNIKTVDTRINFNMDATLEDIGGVNFSGCSGITELHLPNIKGMGKGCFASMSAVTVITMGPNSVITEIPDSTYSNCTALTVLHVPAGVTAIGKQAFDACSALTSVTFEEGSQLKSVGKYAFRKTGLTAFAMPDGVTTLDAGAFASCASLKTITLVRAW